MENLQTILRQLDQSIPLLGNSETKRVVLLNGPPKSGKNVIGARCVRLMNERQFRECSASEGCFKDRLFDICIAISGMDEDTFHLIYENQKEVPRPEFFDLTPRQFLIEVSEEMVKPVRGKRYFGEQAAQQLVSGWNFMTDAGFKDEAQAIIDKVGSENVFHVQLYRNGTDFSNDSRSYYTLKGVPKLILNNNGTILSASTKIFEWLNAQLLEQL